MYNPSYYGSSNSDPTKTSNYDHSNYASTPIGPDQNITTNYPHNSGSDWFYQQTATTTNNGGENFQSANVGNIQTSTNELSGPMTSVNSAAANSNSSINKMYNEDYDFSDEPPLMEELGINISQIMLKARAVILPISRFSPNLPDAAIIDDDDWAAPFGLGLLLGAELLLEAKIHFAYIYGFGLFGCLTMTLILNLICPPDQKSIPLWSVFSILGYSLLPVNILAFFNIFIRIKNAGSAGVCLGLLTIFWCTVASTRLFEKGCGMRNQRYLVAYPAALFYSCFVVITIF